MIPKEAAVLAAAVVAGYFILKSDTEAGFGEAGFGGAGGGEAVEKKEPSEAGDIIYNLPEQVDYSSVIQELLSGQPTFEEVFPEPDPYRAPIDEPKKIDVPTEGKDFFPDTGNFYVDKVTTNLETVADFFMGKKGYTQTQEILSESGKEARKHVLDKWLGLPEYLKEYNIYGEKISDIGKEIIPKQEQAITFGQIFKPEERGIPTYDEEGEIEGLKKTARHYEEQTPGYLATGVYERMSGAFKVLGPTHPGSSYYKTVGYTPPTPTGGRVIGKKGRSLRVAAFREKYNVPSDYSYPVTKTIKVTN